MIMETVIKDLKTLVNSVDIKYSKKAKQFETVDSLRNADEYSNAVLGLDVFDGYSSFDIAILTDAGLVEPKYTFEEILSFVDNKYNIPYNERESVMNAKRKKIISEFVEENNYYRELNGKPNLDDTKLFKLSAEDAALYGVVITDDIKDLYIHEYSDDILYALQQSGYIDKLILENPDKKYLNYLGYNKIDIVTARAANNLSIIKISKDVPDNFYNQFVTVYEQNREYFMTTIYNQDYSSQYDMYDNFIGLCIMIMTIQRIISLAFKSGIERDFYDWQFIQNMYKMYNIPFVEDIPIEYHVTLMKNLNNLLRYKSTDKVLFDICSLLGYERIKIFQYYLVKEHKLDDNEKPIFKYIKEADEDGNPIYVEDKKNMYDLYFQSVNINERNVALALTDTSNRLDYDEVIANDPYWWEDDDLKKAKYDNAFNYIETKYISLNMMYKMTEMLFEITYAFNMMQDNKDSIMDIKIELPKVIDGEKFNLFDVLIYMIALVCKANGFKDGTITNPSKISHIYGFDFNEEQLEIIKTMILDNADKLEIDPITKQPILLKYFSNMDATTSDAVNTLFENIREFNDYIIGKMYSSKNIEEYRIYKTIFNIAMVKDVQNDVFKIDVALENGDIETRTAETYLEYLEYSNPLLANSVKNIDKSNATDMIEHVLSRINQEVESLQYLYIIYDASNPVFNSIVKLLRFFKSYTTDLTAFNVIYLFDSKYYNNIKLIGDIVATSSSYDAKESLNNLYGDIIKCVDKEMDVTSDISSLVEKFSNRISIQGSDVYEKMYDELVSISRKETIKDKTDIIDALSYSLSVPYAIIKQTMYDKGIVNENTTITAQSYQTNILENISTSVSDRNIDTSTMYDISSCINNIVSNLDKRTFSDKLFLKWE